MTRIQVFERLEPCCEKLVISFKNAYYLTSGNTPKTTCSVVAAAVCWLSGNALEEETTVRNNVATALCGIVPCFKLHAVYDWISLVRRLTDENISAEIKCVAWSELHTRFRLWWLILNENVRSLRSTNVRLASLLMGSSVAKAILSSLLTSHQIMKNQNDTQRVEYRLCQTIMAADVDVHETQPWADKVLDWFAERMPQPEMNRRSLYLWGPAGIGKSRLISRLLAGRMCLRRDCCEGFFLQDLAEEYEFVWLDEFVPSIMVTRGEYRQQFNKLTGREIVLVRAKNCLQYEVDASNIRTIISSNEAPPKADYFSRRLLVIKADECLYGNNVQISFVGSSVGNCKASVAEED